MFIKPVQELYQVECSHLNGLLCVCRNEMLPNKTRRLRKRSSTHTKDVVQTTLGPPEQPSTSTTSASVAYPESPDASQAHLGRPDRIFLLASLVFQNIHLEKTASQKIVNYGNKRKVPLPEVRSEERRAAYELAFNTLKCKCNCK